MNTFDIQTLDPMVLSAIIGAASLVSIIIMLVVWYLIIKRAVYAGFKKFYREQQQAERSAQVTQGQMPPSQMPPR